MKKRHIGGLGCLLVLLTAVVVYQLVQVTTRDLWGDLEAGHPPSPPAQRVAHPDAWDEMYRLINENPGPDIRRVLEQQGPPDQAARDQVAAWGPVVEGLPAWTRTSGIFIPSQAYNDPQPLELAPLLHANKALLVSSWGAAVDAADAEAAAEAAGVVDPSVAVLRARQRELLLSSLRFGSMLEHSGPNLIAVMVGTALQQLSHSEIREMMIAGVLDDETLVAVQDELTAWSGWPSGLGAGLAGDCRVMEEPINELREAGLRDIFRSANYGVVVPPAGQTRTRGQASPRWPLNVDRTVAYTRHTCAEQVAAARQPAWERTWPVPDVLWEDGSLNPVQYLDNPVGRVLLGLGLPNWVSMVERGDALLLDRNQTLVALAVERFRRERGVLPADIDALVPDYLPAVPQDAISGEPIAFHGRVVGREVPLGNQGSIDALVFDDMGPIAPPTAEEEGDDGAPGADGAQGAAGAQGDDSAQGVEEEGVVAP